MFHFFCSFILFSAFFSSCFIFRRVGEWKKKCDLIFTGGYVAFHRMATVASTFPLVCDSYEVGCVVL